MNAPISALIRYIELLELKHHKNLLRTACSLSKNEGFYKKEVELGTAIDFTKDYNGEKITKDHPLYELSDIISKFKEGSNTTFNRTEINNINLKEYFDSKGEHFCAGYLSQFGKVARAVNPRSDSFIDTMVWNCKKIVRNKSYGAAKNTYYGLTMPEKYKSIITF